MLELASFIRDDHFIADTISSAAPTLTEWQAALAASPTPKQIAALALIAGATKLAGSAPVLMPLIGSDGITGKASAWALGQLATKENSIEKDLLGAIQNGSLDVRENGYYALSTLAACGMASASLPGIMQDRVTAEIERAKSGGSGLGEHVCRVLAVLGATNTTELIQNVISQDRFCDRFELQRLRKAVEDNGRDNDSIKLLKGNWTQCFAEHLYVEKAPAPEKPAPAKTAMAKPTAAKKIAPPAAPKSTAPNPSVPPMNAPTETSIPADEQMAEDGDENEGAPADGEGQLPPPLDWAAFTAGPEAAALAPQLKQLAGQLGPLLEQLSLRAVRAPLVDLNGQEFVALLLQVLPQALPPQHVQMALSPQALICYKAVIKFLMRTGLATNGPGLLDALKMVRRELTNQMRQAGILNGPDYSDPDGDSEDDPAAESDGDPDLSGPSASQPHPAG